MVSHSSRNPCKDRIRGRLSAVFQGSVFQDPVSHESHSMARRILLIDRFWNALVEPMKRVNEGASLNEKMLVSHRTWFASV